MFICELFYFSRKSTLLTESTVAAKLGYPLNWLIKLRKDGIVNPIRPGGLWLYSEEQIRQIPSLIAEARKCQQCGKPRPFGSHSLCRECRQYRKKERDVAWQKARLEKRREAKAAKQASPPQPSKPSSKK